MLSQLALAASMASTALALPQSQASQPQPANNGFAMLAIRSGDPQIHQHPINAADYGFWIGKPTATACDGTPAECAEYNGTTTVVTASTNGPATLPTHANDFQDVYVDQAGFLKFATGQANTIPEGGIASPFTYTGYADDAFGDGEFLLPGKDIYACEVSEGVYAIKTDVGKDFCADGCVNIAISGSGAKSDVYAYV